MPKTSKYSREYKRRIVKRFADAVTGDEYIMGEEFAKGYGIPPSLFDDWVFEFAPGVSTADGWKVFKGRTV